MKFWEAMKALQDGFKVTNKEWDDGEYIEFVSSPNIGFIRRSLQPDQIDWSLRFNRDDFLCEEWELYFTSFTYTSSSVQYDHFKNDKHRFEFLLDRTTTLKSDLDKLKKEIKK